MSSSKQKNNIFLILFIFFATIFLIKSINSAIGCCDNSYHTNHTQAYDYKTLHYVKCSCHCEQYPLIEKLGQCARCGHYREPVSVIIVSQLRKIRQNRD